MQITISFEVDMTHKTYRVLSAYDLPPFGLQRNVNILHDSHFYDDAKKELGRAIKAAMAENMPAITVPKRDSI